MTQTIGQRELRNDNAEIMRRVEQGESFVVTRNGKPIADLVPHQADGDPRPTAGELIEFLKKRPPIDAAQWRRDREEDDKIFGPDYPENPWERRR
ncbi:type II toxin-antitoxin system Phd/YefM family antitoxin [Amycolatopsis pithecellobii]|uniref:Type II toxin-antitoxin system prevent-host-death family antitoxin n=1 Tax=Amycolatopsis pithecellobii TaxID=664692 RepID=A0A6N7YYI6_9PSEU|nr:type II toxin-antitoxin system prevent-host-death family antitoxin [Amycolatopsis pithecellobii]MTD53963.1 type II toxin-antitoxin system prevent-host-death family antitoxin [Amycolatopsis pithecellobii]